jgi:hypothetical protein
VSYYRDLGSCNLVRAMKPFLESGMLSMRGSDGKFIVNLRVEHNTPWIHARSSYAINCYLWKDILFHGIVEKYLPKEKQFVPLGCQDCFKVVVRPKTLEQLFALEELQKRMDLPSKCGIEIRQSVFGNYGGYFYNRGLPAGLGCYVKVREAVNEDPILGPDIAVILKRGCTEMEHSIGRSDNWNIVDGQVAFEVHLNEMFVNDIPVLHQSEEVKKETHQRWIEYAYGIADETALKYNDGEPLYPDYVTYHHYAEVYFKEKEEQQCSTTISQKCEQSQEKSAEKKLQKSPRTSSRKKSQKRSTSSKQNLKR